MVGPSALLGHPCPVQAVGCKAARSRGTDRNRSPRLPSMPAGQGRRQAKEVKLLLNLLWRACSPPLPLIGAAAPQQGPAAASSSAPAPLYHNPKISAPALVTAPDTCVGRVCGWAGSCVQTQSWDHGARHSCNSLPACPWPQNPHLSQGWCGQQIVALTWSQLCAVTIS